MTAPRTQYPADGQWELALAKQANDAIGRGADPKAVTARLGDLIKQHRAQAQPQPAAEEPSSFGQAMENVFGVGANALKGGLASFDDEAAGLLGALAQGSSYTGKFSRNYHASKADWAKHEQDFTDAHPKTAVAAQIAGAIAPAVVSGGGSLTARLGLTGLKAMLAEGAAYGAAQGVGEDDGDLLSMLKSGAKGAATGAAGAGALGVAGKAGSTVWNVGKGLVTPAAKRAATSGVELMAKMAEQGKGGLAQMLANAASDASVGAKPLFATAGGEGINDLAWLAGNTPSKGRQTLLDVLTDAKSAERPMLAGQLRKAADAGDESAYKLAQRIDKTRGVRAAKLYDRAEAAPAIHDTEIYKIIGQHPELQEAAQGVLRSLGERATPEEQAAGQAIEYLAKNPNVDASSIAQPIPIRFLNLFKQATDDVVRARSMQGVGDGAKATFGRLDKVRVQDALNDILGRGDQLSPEFAAARADYAAHSKQLSALDAGSNALKKRPEQVADELAGNVPLDPDGPYDDVITEATKPLYKQGGVSAMVDRMADQAKSPHAVFTKDLAGEGTRNERLVSLLGDEGRAKLEPALDAARRVEATDARVFGGSSTVKNANVKEVVNQQFTPADAMQLLEAPKRAVYHILSRFSKVQRESFAEALGDTLAQHLATDPNSPAGAALVAKMRQVLDEQSVEAILARAKSRARIGRGVSRGASILSKDLTQDDTTEVPY